MIILHQIMSRNYAIVIRNLSEEILMSKSYVNNFYSLE